VLAVRLAYGEQQRHDLRQESARDKPKHPGRGIVDPLEIVHDAEQRLLLGNASQQAERCQRDREAVRRIAGCETQSDPEGDLLRLGERTEPVKQRAAQLVQPGVRQLHLRLDARDLSHPNARRPLGGVTQKRGLPNARLATDNEHGTLPAAHLIEHLIQPRKLAGSSP